MYILYVNMCIYILVYIHIQINNLGQKMLLYVLLGV